MHNRRVPFSDIRTDQFVGSYALRSLRFFVAICRQHLGFDLTPQCLRSKVRYIATSHCFHLLPVFIWQEYKAPRAQHQSSGQLGVSDSDICLPLPLPLPLDTCTSGSHQRDGISVTLALSTGSFTFGKCNRSRLERFGPTRRSGSGGFCYVRHVSGAATAVCS